MFGGTEIIGYVASALVVLSLTMDPSVRIVSLVGSVVFVIYGVLIESIPIVHERRDRRDQRVVPRQELGLRRDLGAVVVPLESPFVQDFIAFHLEDIRRFQPGSTIPEPTPSACCSTATACRPAR